MGTADYVYLPVQGIQNINVRKNSKFFLIIIEKMFYICNNKYRDSHELKGHDQNVSAYSRRSVNSGGVVNLTFTYAYVRTYVVGAYWIAALCNLISTP